MKEDLINPYLFGNEAGEDEDKQRLSDYYLEKEKNKAFYDRKRKKYHMNIMINQL